MNEALFTGTVWYLRYREVVRLWAANREEFKQRVINNVNRKRLTYSLSELPVEEFSFGPISRKE